MLVAAGAFIVFMIQTVLLKQLDTIIGDFGVPILSSIHFRDYQFLLYGIALVLMMLFRPEGLFPSQRRRRELHIAEEFAEGIGDEGSVAGGMGEVPGSDDIFGGGV